MKKLLVVAMIAFGFATNAQSIKFGPKVGLNISDLRGSEKDSDMKTSFVVGGMAEFKLSDQFALQPELLYSSQGANAKNSSLGGLVNIGASTKLDYLNIPIIAKYFVIDNLALEFGPQVGFLTSAKLNGSSTIAGLNSSGNEIDVKDNYNSVDFGLNFGASYTLDFGLNIGVRYILGLTDIREADSLTEKNGVIQISAGYFF